MPNAILWRRFDSGKPCLAGRIEAPANRFREAAAARIPAGLRPPACCLQAISRPRHISAAPFSEAAASRKRVAVDPK
jgi:hypothetical protein